MNDDNARAASTAAEGGAAIAAAESHNAPKITAKAKLEELCVSTIRFLAIDGVEKAKSGHPGAPMGMADMAFVLWTDFMRHDPQQPDWKDRDRFVLSAGHASMLLYSLLHLTGYPEMTMDELQHFRQWGSKTAGHPEYGDAPGIEVTTGPLGQGFANGVGMGIASKMLAARFNGGEGKFKPVDNHIYVICSDGDLEEGISSEAASVAGHLGLGNLIYLYDDNDVTLDGDIRLSFSEDVKKRFEAVGWHVQKIDGHDRDAVRKAIKKAQKHDHQPSLIMAKTIIGRGSPRFHGTSRAHGEPLGPEETKATKEAVGWPLEPTFYVSDEVRAEFARKVKKLARSRKVWEQGMAEWRAANPQLAEEWDRYWSHALPDDYARQLVVAAKVDKPTATRDISNAVIQKLASIAPFVVGGAADLASSTKTNVKDGGSIERPKGDAKPPAFDLFKGRNLHFGIREHAMAAGVNGMTLYGAWRAYGSTFLIFSDYMRPAIRLAALMKIPSIFVYTHDSVFLGEDGPTHQSVEQLFSLRLIPNMTLFRPSDGPETAMAWAWAVGSKHDGPTLIVCTRQKLDVVPHGAGFDPQSVWRGAYVLDGYADGDFTIIATGSEVPLAVKAADLLRGEGVRARVVSAPCLDLFDRQGVDYQNEILGSDRSKVVAIEAGRSAGWYKYVNHDALVIGIDRFGASAPAEQIAEHFGFTPEKVAERIRGWRK